MKAIAIFLLFVGMFLVVQGYYSQKTHCPVPEIQVKYIPQSQYDEQLPSDPSKQDKEALKKHFKSMFESTNPWFNTRGQK